MSDRTPIPLTPTVIGLKSTEFATICEWPFADAFVGRMLRSDIPQLVRFYDCRIWIYRDPDGQLVGFGTIDICDDYQMYTAWNPHPYIPLLAVNPTIKSQGYGTSILHHLIGEAAILASHRLCHDILFLDVYTTSNKAIELYERSGFMKITDEPILDPLEPGMAYLIMAKRVS